jgi:acyl-homoserine-lactone acylase
VQCNNSVFSSTRPSPINEKDHSHYRAIRDAEFRPDSRAARAFALLDSKPRITWDDHMRAALDVKALTAQPLLDAVLSGLQARTDNLSPDLKQIESILAKWDGMATLENRAIPILSHVYRIALARDVDLSSTPGRALEITEAAAAEMRSLYGTVDVPMSRVHVLERGGREFAMPGVGNNTKLNPFTSLLMTGADRYNSGKWYVNSGSSWMMVVSFESPMKVFTLLPLGQSEDPASPHHTDQAALFSRRELKPLAFTDAEVRAASERSYALKLPKEYR